jgi:hypothetical protein
VPLLGPADGGNTSIALSTAYDRPMTVSIPIPRFAFALATMRKTGPMSSTPGMPRLPGSGSSNSVTLGLENEPSALATRCRLPSTDALMLAVSAALSSVGVGSSWPVAEKPSAIVAVAVALASAETAASKGTPASLQFEIEVLKRLPDVEIFSGGGLIVSFWMLMTFPSNETSRAARKPVETVRLYAREREGTYCGHYRRRSAASSADPDTRPRTASVAVWATVA